MTKPGRGGVAGIAVDFLGDVAEGGIAAAGSVIGGSIQAIGSAAQGAGAALGGALNGMLRKPDVIVNNVGIVGQAGKEKVQTSTGSAPPAAKKDGKANVDANMPTTKLLSIAVKYLASISDTLEQQINFEKDSFERQQAAEREAMIEGEGKGNALAGLGSKFGDLKNRAKDAAPDASTLLKAGAIFAGITTLGLSQLDRSEIDRLKQNVQIFSEKYSWLGDMAMVLSGAVAGARGGVWGMIAGAVGAWLMPDIIAHLTGENVSGGKTAAIATAGLGYAGYQGFKATRAVRGAGNTALELATRPNYANMSRGGQAAARAGSGGAAWLSGRTGRRFLAFLGRKFGQAFMRRVSGLLARVMAGVAISATGIGAIPGIIWSLVNIGLSLWLVWDVINAWWEFQEEEKALGDAERVEGPAVAGTAGQVSAPPASSTGASAQNSGQNAATSYVPSGDQKVDFAMTYLMRELDLTAPQASGIIGNLMAESRLDTNAFNEAGGGRGAYGIAQWRGPRQNALDAFAASRGKSRDDYETQLAFLAHELKTDAGNGLAELKQTTTSADAARVFLDKFERPGAHDRAASMQRRMSYAMAAESGTSMQTAQSDYVSPASAAAQAAGGTAATGGALETLAPIIKGFGTGLKTLMGGGTYNPSPVSSTAPNNIARIIEDEQRMMDVSRIAGINDADKTASMAKNMPPAAQSLANANGGSLSPIDPNYKTNDLVMGYLSHFKAA